MSRPGREMGVRVSALLFHKDSFKLTLDISMCKTGKIILEKAYVKSTMKPRLIPNTASSLLIKDSLLCPWGKKALTFSLNSSWDDPSIFICFKYTKIEVYLIFNSLKQKKLTFNFFVYRNRKKLTDNRKRAKILADNRKIRKPRGVTDLFRFYFSLFHFFFKVFDFHFAIFPCGWDFSFYFSLFYFSCVDKPDSCLWRMCQLSLSHS